MKDVFPGGSINIFLNNIIGLEKDQMILRKPNSTIRKLLLMVAGILVIVVIAAQLYAKHYAEVILRENIPQKYGLGYTNLKVNIITGGMQIENVIFQFSDNDSVQPNSRVSLGKLRIDGFSLWQYFFNKTVNISGIEIDSPHAAHYTFPPKPEADSISRSKQRPEIPVSIGTLKIRNGSIGIIWQNADSTKLAAHGINLSMKGIIIDSNTIKNKVPFAFRDVSVSANNILYDMGLYERLKVKALNLRNEELKLDGLTINTKLGKNELSGRLKKERDYIALEVPEIKMVDFDLGFNEGRFYISAAEGTIQRPSLEVYRDKLVADDPDHKKMYSKMLRELPADLNIHELAISQGHVGYEERVEADAGPGRIFFDKIDLQIENISNTYAAGEKTHLKANALFMENAAVSIDWSFDVNDTDDTFLASGTFKDFKAESINTFLESNMRSRARGRADEIYFTISGDAARATGDLKMKYRDFEFVILKKNKPGINKLLTAIGNVFISKNSKSDEDGYRYGKIEAERDPTKSFFNYLWINIRSGLVSTLTGNGEKK